MAISEYATFSMTVSTTELSMTGGTSTIQTQTDDGVYQVFVDLNAATETEEFTFYVREKDRSSGTQRQVPIGTCNGTGVMFISDSYLLMHGWDFTVIKNAGTDRTLTGSVRRIS